eukprot:s1382_g18.t1
MAASPQTQVDALAQLLTLKEDVNKEVHLKCVVNALSSVELDAETALKVSAIIEKQAAFSQEEKERLQKCLSEQVKGEAAVKRKPYQDFTKLPSFLTDEVWDALSAYPYTRAADILMEHAFRVGLRNPSEPTYACLTALLCIFHPAKTGFGLAQTYETTKSTWQSFKKKRKNRIQAGDLHLLELPAPGDLPEVLKIVAFGQQPRVESRIRDTSLQDLQDKIVMMKSHMLAPKNSVAQLGATGGAMVSQPVHADFQHAGGPLVKELIGALVHLAQQRSEQQEVPIQILRKSSSEVSSVPSSASALQKALLAPASETADAQKQPSMASAVDPGLHMLSQLQENKVDPTLAAPAVATGSAADKQDLQPSKLEPKDVDDAVSQAQQMVADLEKRPKTSKQLDATETSNKMKRPAAAGRSAKGNTSKVNQTSLSRTTSSGNKGLKRPASVVAKPQPKSAQKKKVPDKLLRNYEKHLLEGPMGSTVGASSSSAMPPPQHGKPSSASTSGGQGTAALLQESPVHSGNVYVQATAAHCASTAGVQGAAPVGANHAPSEAPQGGNVYVRQDAHVNDDMSGSTTGSPVAPAAALGKDLLQDRARKLQAVPKSQGSKSKRQQFLETHGFKRARGGKCREYFGNVYHRDP